MDKHLKEPSPFASCSTLGHSFMRVHYKQKRDYIHVPDTHLQILKCSALLRSSLSPTITSHPGRLVGTSVWVNEGGKGGREKELRDGGRRERGRV